MAVARVTKLTASSGKGFEAAVQSGIKRAAKTVRGMTGLHVLEQKAKIEKGKITYKGGKDQPEWLIRPPGSKGSPVGKP